jgi:hypothetical protein
MEGDLVGLLDFLFNSSYPTSDWSAFDDRKLRFDFDKNALCEVAIGDRMERLRFLGPAEDAKAASNYESLLYYSKGLFVTLDNETIVGYVIFFQDVCENKYAPFAGTCLANGRQIELSRETTEAQLLDLWGEPYWRDAKDDDEILLFFERGNIEWQIELDGFGGLLVINVVSPPMLADKAERERYKITKSWPPTER